MTLETRPIGDKVGLEQPQREARVTRLAFMLSFWYMTQALLVPADDIQQPSGSQYTALPGPGLRGFLPTEPFPVHPHVQAGMLSRHAALDGYSPAVSRLSPERCRPDRRVGDVKEVQSERAVSFRGSSMPMALRDGRRPQLQHSE